VLLAGGSSHAMLASARLSCIICGQLPDNSSAGGVVGWVLDQRQSVTESEASYI